MRRSRSSSGIPLPASMQQNTRDSRNRERARSIVRRDRSLDAHTPLGHHRILLSGTDKKYSTQKNLLRTPSTPLTFAGFKRSTSLSSFGSKISVARNKSPGDRKTLQKLITDKKWVAEQYLKVQEFIESSGLFNPELAGKLRPPTVAIFIEIITVLFRRIIKTIPINIQNYVDVTLQTLKLLRYPGQITASTAKMVNTMHGWPHFIAIISWLIDRVDLAGIHNGFREQQDEDVKVAFNMHDAVFEFLATKHYIVLHNSEDTANEEFVVENEDKLYADMLRITGTDHEAALKIRERLETERSEVSNIESRLEEIEEENMKIQAQNLERQNVIDNYEDSKGNREREVKEEVIQLKKTLSNHAEIKAALILSVKELEDRISKQSCKHREKLEILMQIEDLKRVIERKQGKLAEYGLVRDELDIKLRTLVAEIEGNVDSWNLSITKTFLPELKMLRLREKGFHSAGFLEEIREIRKEKEELQEKLLKEYMASHGDIEKLRIQKESLEESNKVMVSTRKRLDDLGRAIQLLEDKNRNIMSDLDDCKKNHELNIKSIQEYEENKIRDNGRIILEFHNRNQHVTQKIDETSKKGISVILEAHNMAIRNIQKLDETMHLMLKDGQMYLRESKENLQESFDHLLSLQKITEKLYQVVGEENKENESK